jgi:biopolymer transport protein ExbB
MVNSFNQISVSVGGVDPRRLAAGIFEALMTTVMGLIVAIPSLYAFGIFRNRVDAIVSEATGTAEHMIHPLRTQSQQRSTQTK